MKYNKPRSGFELRLRGSFPMTIPQRNPTESVCLCKCCKFFLSNYIKFAELVIKIFKRTEYITNLSLSLYIYIYICVCVCVCVYITYIRFIYWMPWNLVCDFWVSWSFYKTTIIWHLTKWNESKIEKYSQKPLGLCRNLYVYFCVCVGGL